MKKNNFAGYALVERIKRKGSKIFQLFPISNRLKFPIFFDVLIAKISSLKSKYNNFDFGPLRVYQNVELNIKEIKKELNNKGGIYLWWCKDTGLFYIGSAKSFFAFAPACAGAGQGGKNGRLHEYFQNNRLINRINSKISSDVAKDMLMYPKSNWNLVILEMIDLNETLGEDKINVNLLREKEQFWMLLLPTYNRSLVVGSNEGLPMSEDKRESLSTLIYIYEISDEGKLIPNSEQKVFGIKELSRIGIKSQFSGLITAVNLWDIQAHLKSGLPLKNKFLLFKIPLSLEEQISWKLVMKTKGSGVWVYDFNSIAGNADAANLIEYFDSVKACREKYNIPLTTFKRLRKHRLNYKGYLFSDFQL
uniref:GIY-YIG domain-containing protein n=1 Tax=Phlebia radiata TaxID=5308 RepID=L8B985_PHLRA|nr:hypothetical protein PRA_mt0061 [Phlebia radiata]CCE89183.1 hypothetical protein PRA_mt0061 [Phlebia radiata]